MKKNYKNKWIFVFILMMFCVVNNIEKTYANEPIMEYKYTVEEQKIKRAHFIWKTCIEELRLEKILTNKDVVNINKYLNDNLKSKVFLEAPMTRYKREKDILKAKTVDELIDKKIINKQQGEKLIKKLSKYNLSNLEK